MIFANLGLWVCSEFDFVFFKLDMILCFVGLVGFQLGDWC